jgi:hypothetical protein
MSDFQPHKTAVTAVGGDVYLSLPDDSYIRVTPDRARKLAAALFTQANAAEGKPDPEVVILKPSKGTPS